MDELVERFRGMLRGWAEAYAKSRGTPDAEIDAFEDLHPDEAAGFLKAIDHGIVKVDAVGGCTVPLLDRLHGHGTEPSTLFWRTRTPIGIGWREYIMQVGVAAYLIVDQGWPAQQVAIDPGAEATFDVATYRHGLEGEAPFIVAEVKTLRNKRALKLMLDQLHAAGKGKVDLYALDLRRDGHKKYRGLLRERPSYFLAVRPGSWLAFAIVWDSGFPVLESVESVPSFNELAL